MGKQARQVVKKRAKVRKAPFPFKKKKKVFSTKGLKKRHLKLFKKLSKLGKRK